MPILSGRGWQSFDRDPRRQQELRMRPAADNIYRAVFDVTDIQRFDDHEDRHILDRLHAIDVMLMLQNGMILTGQEKFLSPDKAKFQSLTVEYEQDQKTGEQGDWFHLASQLYFCGYADPQFTHFQSFVIVYWPMLVFETSRGAIIWQQNRNKNNFAKASFKYINFAQIPKSCLIAGKW